MADNSGADNNTSVKKKKRSLKKDLFTILCIGEVLITSVFIFFMAYIDQNAKPLDFSLKDFKSDYIEFKNNCWYVDEKLVQTDKDIELIIGPYKEVGKGSYNVVVEYETDEEQCAYALLSSFVKSGLGRLQSTSNKASFKTDLNQGIAEFEIAVKYNGKGSLKITNITMTEDHSRMGRTLVYCLVIFAIADIWIIYAEEIKKNRTLILSLFGIIIMTSLPLFTKGIGKGHDLFFHVMRIEALADSLTHGVFPNRVSDLWFDGYGYPTSIYYGDILLYIPALMRIVGFSIVTAYKIYVLFINICTVLFGYLSFKQMFKNRYSALMAIAVYSTATYRLINVYIRAAVGEYTAMMFMPVIACGMYLIYTGDMKNRREYLKASGILSIGMTGLIGCHILSTEMVCLILAITCVLLIKKTIKLPVLRALGISIFETVLLTLYFTVPFLDYYKNVTVDINNTVADSLLIQKQGCSIAEYFAVFRDIFSQYSIHKNARLAATPGLILLLSIGVGMIVLIYSKHKKYKGELTLYIVMSLISLFLASDVFPWDILSARTTVGRLLAQVQFPWRYVTLAIVFSTLVFGWLYNRFEDKNFGSKTYVIKQSAMVCVLLAGAIASMYFDGAYLDDIKFKDWYDGGDIDTWSVGSGEYKLSDFKKKDLNGKLRYKNMQQITELERVGTKTVLYCETSNKSGVVRLPVFNYKGYVVKDDNGKTYEITDGSNNTISFSVPARFKGNITIDFISPWYWRLSEIISLLSFIIFTSYFVIYFRKSKNKIE